MSERKIYTGIGSRETPKDVCELMRKLAIILASKGFTLRSGGADGADNAFEVGATKKQIFLPWDGFNGRRVDGISYLLPEYTETYLKKYHPAPHRLTVKGKQFMSRNCNQVLGEHLDTPTDFILCWTKDGKASGGTGFALRMAPDYQIPVFNLKHGLDDFKTFFAFTYGA